MDTLDKFYEKFRTKKYNRGDIILLQDVTPAHAFAVKSGVIRSYTTTHSMGERSISFIVDHEVFPICWLFSKTTATLYYYIAHTDCELYIIDKDIYLEHVRNSSSISYALLNHNINDYVTKTLQITALEQTKAVNRILHTMNYFSLRYGNKLMNDVTRINIPLTQKDIASFTGLARETVAAELIKIQNKNIVSKKDKFYTVNITNLRRYVKDEQIESLGINIGGVY